MALWWFLVECGCLPSLSCVLRAVMGCHLRTRTPWASLYVGLSYLSHKPSTYCCLWTCLALPCLHCLERLLSCCWWLQKQKVPLNLCDCLKGSFQRYTSRKAGCLDDCSFHSFFRSCPGLLYNKGIHFHEYFRVSNILGPSLEHLNCFVM